MLILLLARRQLKQLLVVYLGLTVARILIYGLHVYLEQMTKTLSFDHFLSDHIVLGASLTAILQSEMTFLIEQPPGKLNSEIKYRMTVVLWMTAVVLDLLLFGLTCGDMFYTALYFHPREQSMAAYSIGSTFHLVGRRILTMT